MYVSDNNNDIKHDGYYLLRPPCQTVREGCYSSVPFLRRANRGEVTSVQETVKIKPGLSASTDHCPFPGLACLLQEQGGANGAIKVL